MTETWSYRRAYAELDALVYSLKYDGMFNRLVFDSPSRVCEHQISPKKGVEMKGRMVVWDRNFSLVPEAFLGSEPPEIEIDTKVLLDEGLYLCYKGKNRQHLFQSVYLEAQKVAEDKANTVFFWWFSSTLYVVLFKKQQLQFANIFDVSSASEVAYFILAATQECGMHQEAFSLVGDAESENLQLLDTELEKLGIQVLAVNRSDLYPGYFNSPQQILSGYLYHMPQCALPEAY